MKKVSKILFVILILVCFMFSIGCAEEQPSSPPPTLETPETHEDTTIKDIYALNDEIFMNYLLMDIDGNQYRITDGTLEYPSGKLYKNTEYELFETGKYSLNYTAKNGDDVKTGIKQFDVLSSYYSFTTDYSTAEYGDNIPYTVFTTGVYYDKITGKEIYRWGGGLDTAYASGLKISLAEGDEFKWAKPLTLTDGLNDLFNIVLPHASPYTSSFPDLTGVPKQADRLIVTLTDCYDSDKTLEIVFDFSRKYGMICIRSGVNGDVASSLNKDESANSRYKAEQPQKHCFINNTEYVCIYGTRGTELNAMEPNGYTLTLDTYTAELFTSTDTMRNKEKEEERSKLINQYNNTDIHEDISKHLSGFTNNEVFLSIKCEDYYDSTCEFILTNILGSSQEEFKAEKYIDSVKPLINVKAPSESVKIISGKEFSVFDAECLDVNLKQDYTVGCYFAYGTSNQTAIKIVDGKLKLPIEGTYSLVYRVYDRYGNYAEKIITLNAKTSGETLIYDKNKLTDVNLGEEVTLPSLGTVVGLNGDVSITKTITDQNGGEIKIDNDDKFMLLNAGKYQVKYVLSDGIFVENFVYEINGVKNEDNVQFLDEINLGKYLMQGRIYSFDDYYAYTFENDTPTARETEVWAKADGGSFVKVENYNSYKVTANNTLQFKFVYDDCEIESDVLRIVDCGLKEETEPLNLPGYFVVDGGATVTKVETDDFVKINATNESVIDFINPISFKAFAIRFNIPENQAKFDRINFVVTDFYDNTKSVKIGFEKGVLANNSEEVLSKMFVNDKSITINKFIGSALTVEYKNKNIQVDSSKIAIGDIFTSDKVLLSIEIKGNVDIIPALELQLIKINSQTLGTDEDGIAPDICVKSATGRYNVGSTLTLYNPIITDVLSPINSEKTTITVKNAAGAFLKDVNGNELNKFVIKEDIQVKVESIGKIYVTYFAEDMAGNKIQKGRGKNYTLDIVDITAPTIELEGGYNKLTIKTANIDDEITIANYAVSDDFTPSEGITVSVRVYTPYNEAFTLEGNNFVVNRTGTYRVVYTCVDANGNMSETYYSINVR